MRVKNPSRFVPIQMGQSQDSKFSSLVQVALMGLGLYMLISKGIGIVKSFSRKG